MITTRGGTATIRFPYNTHSMDVECRAPNYVTALVHLSTSYGWPSFEPSPDSSSESSAYSWTYLFNNAGVDWHSHKWTCNYKCFETDASDTWELHVGDKNVMQIGAYVTEISDEGIQSGYRGWAQTCNTNTQLGCNDGTNQNSLVVLYDNVTELVIEKPGWRTKKVIVYTSNHRDRASCDKYPSVC